MENRKHLTAFTNDSFTDLITAIMAFSTFRYTGAASLLTAEYQWDGEAHLYLVEILRRYHFACFYDDFHDLSSFSQQHAHLRRFTTTKLQAAVMGGGF